ncbi:MAG: hypothetical protein Q9174_003156 [Haloplaca sp. 1 TL-2023]
MVLQILHQVLQSRSEFSDGAQRSTDQIKSQWQSPSAILPILLIVAGDIVGGALDQLSGPGIVPVVFSFGWVSYAHKAFVSAIGVHRLLSEPQAGDGDSKMINVDTGRKAKNRSTVLRRVIRDLEYWKPKEAKEAEERRKKGNRGDIERAMNGRHRSRQTAENAGEGASEKDDDDDASNGLRILIFDASSKGQQGHPSYDRVWCSGIAIAILQLGIASIPFGLHGEWLTLMITGIGNILAFTTGALPQFGKEKWWRCKEKSWKTIALTKDNSTTEYDEIVVIRSMGIGLDLEDMASGSQSQAFRGQRWNQTTLRKGGGESPTLWPWTRFATGFLAACWIALLIMVAGFRGSSWYLLATGAIGLVQNAFVAGAPRTPDAQGLHLQYQEMIEEDTVGATLNIAEKRYPRLGSSLRKNLYSEVSKL